MKNYYVYILTNQRNGTLYIGVTSDLIKRVWQHKNKLVDGFTSKYDINKLVYFELHEDVEAAIAQEKRLKRWKRAWKVVLIEKQNPYWDDLYESIIG
ncbi:MAG: GIY-YIG nuclease family protein [Proteobacteria bacterium]|nr:GIY-YIG nuclease family protein [Pseudomonadota bacterium]